MPGSRSKKDGKKMFGISESNLLFSLPHRRGGGNINNEISLYWENSREFNPFLELFRELAAIGDVKFAKHAEGYLLQVGHLQFKTVVDSSRSSITLVNIDILSTQVAQVLIKIAEAFFYDRDRKFKLGTINGTSEQLMWDTMHEMKIGIEARDNDQATRFEHYAKIKVAQSRQELPPLFHQPHQDQHDSSILSNIESPAQTPESNILFSKRRQHIPLHDVSLYWENTLEYKSLLELFRELVNYGEINFSQQADGFLLKIGGYELKSVMNFNRSLLSMFNIDVLHPQAAELMAKIANLLNYEQRRNFELGPVSLGDEKRLWVAMRDQGLDIQGSNPEQAKRFADYAKEWAQGKYQEPPSLFRGNDEPDNAPDSEPQPEK